MYKIFFSIYAILLLLLLSMTFTILISIVPLQGNIIDTNNSSTPSRISANRSDEITVIDTVGDLDCSSILRDRIEMDNPTLFIALGDLCYKRDLTNFTVTYSDLKNTNKLECVIGNHDSLENGDLRVLNQALEYCGDHWYRKVANNSTLLIGLNTNGNTSLQANWGQSLVTNSSFMKEVKNIILLSHKPAHTPPGSDHKAEYSTVSMFSKITSNLSKHIDVYEITAHNHLMAESSNGKWFISGAGSKKLYDYSEDPQWPFVNNKERGYLQFKINNTDGSVLGSHFYSIDGRLLH